MSRKRTHPEKCYIHNCLAVTDQWVDELHLCAKHAKRACDRGTTNNIENLQIRIPWNKHKEQQCCINNEYCTLHTQSFSNFEDKIYCPKHYMRMKRYGDPNAYWLAKGKSAKCHQALQRHYTILTDRKGFVAEHREIAEQALGRKLKCGEIVHHFDGNKKNNKNSNLCIMTREYHREHFARLHPWLFTRIR